MTSIHDLGNQLAAALGMAPRALAYIADDLAKAGMIGGADEPATAEDAGKLLVAATGDFDVRAPWCAIRRFWNLPLTTVQMRIEEMRTAAQ